MGQRPRRWRTYNHRIGWYMSYLANPVGNVVYKKLIDDTTTTNVTYIGEAVLGTATSAASWRIKRIDETVAGLVTITWSGTGFTSEWDERVATVYS